MREIRTYGLMRGRTYPMRGVPLYSTKLSLTQRIRVSEKWGIPNQYINL